MIQFIRTSLFYRWMACCFLAVFSASVSCSSAIAQDLFLPTAGTRVGLSPEFSPAILRGVKVHPENPFRFDFILDKGDSILDEKALTEESRKLVRYFLASLTTPEKDMWVNLSPYEKDRIIPESFGVTEMGRDMLAQDYMLKQITASLIYPEDAFGKIFWEKVYAQAREKYGTTDIPVNTFNKVWIVPSKAVVYENAATAFVVESRLKVLLEEDYVSLSKSEVSAQQSQEGFSDFGLQPADSKDVNKLGSQIVREIVIPALEKEVNEGKNFSQLRQIYNSLILAAWYKKKIKDSILRKIYIDRNKTSGVDVPDKNVKQEIYEQYLKAFKQGVYNYIKEDYDEVTQETVPRKYFSGGVDFAMQSDTTALKGIENLITEIHEPARAANAIAPGRSFQFALETKPMQGGVPLQPRQGSLKEKVLGFFAAALILGAPSESLAQQTAADTNKVSSMAKFETTHAKEMQYLYDAFGQDIVKKSAFNIAFEKLLSTIKELDPGKFPEMIRYLKNMYGNEEVNKMAAEDPSELQKHLSAIRRIGTEDYGAIVKAFSVNDFRRIFKQLPYQEAYDLVYHFKEDGAQNFIRGVNFFKTALGGQFLSTLNAVDIKELGGFSQERIDILQQIKNEHPILWGYTQQPEPSFETNILGVIKNLPTVASTFDRKSKAETADSLKVLMTSLLAQLAYYHGTYAISQELYQRIQFYIMAGAKIEDGNNADHKFNFGRELILKHSPILWWVIGHEMMHNLEPRNEWSNHNHALGEMLADFGGNYVLDARDGPSAAAKIKNFELYDSRVHITQSMGRMSLSYVNPNLDEHVAARQQFAWVDRALNYSMDKKTMYLASRGVLEEIFSKTAPKVVLDEYYDLESSDDESTVSTTYTTKYLFLRYLQKILGLTDAEVMKLLGEPQKEAVYKVKVFKTSRIILRMIPADELQKLKSRAEAIKKKASIDSVSPSARYSAATPAGIHFFGAWEDVLGKMPQVENDSAMLADGSISNDFTRGGIDFNADKMNLIVDNEGKGIDFTFDPSQLENLDFDGLLPEISDFKAVKNITGFLGVEQFVSGM